MSTISIFSKRETHNRRARIEKSILRAGGSTQGIVTKYKKLIEDAGPSESQHGALWRPNLNFPARYPCSGCDRYLSWTWRASATGRSH